jgi:hypothetical protein
MRLIVMAGLLLAAVLGQSTVTPSTKARGRKSLPPSGDLLTVVLACGLALFLAMRVPEMRARAQDRWARGYRRLGIAGGLHHGAAATALLAMGTAVLL